MTTTLTELKGVLGEQGLVRACLRRDRSGHDAARGRVDRSIGRRGRRPTTSARVADRSEGRTSGGEPRRHGGPTSGVVAAPGLPVGRRAGADTGAGTAHLLVFQAPVVPRRRHHAGPDEGHRDMVRARLAGPAPPVQQGHPVAQGRRRLQQLRPVRPCQARHRGRPPPRHRDQGLQPLHDRRASMQHQLPGRDARSDHLDPRGEAVPRRAGARARPQPRSRPRQLPHLHAVGSGAFPKRASATPRSTATCGTPWGSAASSTPCLCCAGSAGPVGSPPPPSRTPGPCATRPTAGVGSRRFESPPADRRTGWSTEPTLTPWRSHRVRSP